MTVPGSGNPTVDRASSGAGTNNVLRWPASDAGSKMIITDDFVFTPTVYANGIHDIDIASIVWRNVSTDASSTPDEFRSDASLGIDFTDPVATSGSELVRFRITNTLNTEPDSTDRTVGVDLALLDYSGLNLGSNVNILGFMFDAANAFSFMVNGDDNVVWRVSEGETSTMTISMRVDVVPLPAAGLLLLGGMAGLGFVSRKRKAA